jgi:hypothetical protein
MEKTLNTGADMTETQLGENYNYFIEFLKESFTGERLEKLLKLYSENRYGIQLTTAPASGKASFHYAFPGGYLLHVMNVVNIGKYIQLLFQKFDGTIDYTEEERVFSALHHDLGKLGDEEFGPYYMPQTDEWRQRKLGEIYAHNKESPPWEVTDRALYILQKEGIAVTWKETLAIKLSDGMFVEKNRPYFTSFDGLKTRLPEITHWADWMSCRAEKCQWEKLQ